MTTKKNPIPQPTADQLHNLLVGLYYREAGQALMGAATGLAASPGTETYKFVTRQAAIDRTGMSPSSFDRWVKRKKLRKYKFDGQTTPFFMESDIVDLLEEVRNRTTQGD